MKMIRVICAVVSLVCLTGLAAAQTSATASAPATAIVEKPSTAPVAVPVVPALIPAPTQWLFVGGKQASYTLGSLDKSGGYLMQVTLTTQGAAVENLKLADYFVTVEDRQLFDKVKTQAKYEEALAANPGKYKGHYSLLNAVGGKYLPMETRAVGLTDIGGWDVASNQWLMAGRTTQDDKESISFELLLCRDLAPGESANPPADKQVLKITKTYTLIKNSYSFTMSVTMEDRTGKAMTCWLDQAGPAGVPEELHQRAETRTIVIGKYDTDRIQPHRKAAADLPSMSLGEKVRVGISSETPATLWIAETNKFFGSIMYIVPEQSGLLAAKNYDASFYVIAASDPQTPPRVLDGKTIDRSYLTSVTIPSLSVNPGKPVTVNFSIFAGPKNRDMLSGEPPLGQPEYKTRGYINIIDLGGSCNWCTFEWLAFGMMWLLDMFYKIWPHNYGLAIIVLVVLTRLVLHPLTKKGQVSMSRMQKLAPKMNEIKAKYADDKETLNREMMKVYREQGMGPIMGCLPMMLQMPIWIALWTALSTAVELRHAAFLPVWITDLAAPDAIYTFVHPLVVPLIGWSIEGINLLPILLTIATVLQTKLTPQMSATSPDAAKQQKMMMYMMPGMMLLIFYNAPAGLTLYIMASTFAGVAEQYVIRKHIRQRDEAEASSETRVEVSGKAMRGNKTKKQKGQNWTKH